MTIPNGWHIKYNPKPIPIRGHDWDFWHDEVDNDSRLCGTAGSEEDAKLAIMEKQAERYGFDKHADKPDDFDSHINIESLQQRIDEQREKVATWIMSLGLSTGHGDTLEDLLKEAHWQVREYQQRIATLEAACEASRRYVTIVKSLKNSAITEIARRAAIDNLCAWALFSAATVLVALAVRWRVWL